MISRKIRIKLADAKGEQCRKWESGTPLKIKSVLRIEKLGVPRRSLPSIAFVYGSRHPNLKKVFTKLVGALRPGYEAEVMKCEHPWRGVALLYKRLFVRSLPAFITDDLPIPSARPASTIHPRHQLHDGRPKQRANRKTRVKRRWLSFEIVSLLVRVKLHSQNQELQTLWQQFDLHKEEY